MDPNQTSPNDPNMPSGQAIPATPEPTAQPQQPASFATPAPEPAQNLPNSFSAAPQPAPSGLSQANWNVPNPGSGIEPTQPAPAQPNPTPSWDSLDAGNTPQPQNPAPAPSFSETVQTPTTPAPEPAQPQSGLPSWATTDTLTNPAPSHIEPLEPAPTDLSQLSSMGTDSTVYTPPVSSPETLVVPPTNPIPENSTPETHRKLPKGFIIVGAILLLLVVAASAYFILGVGKSSETPQASSLPAQQQLPLTEPPKPVTQPVASGSGTSSFGNLGGSSASASPTTPSALDLLRQRQATTSATP